MYHSGSTHLKPSFFAQSTSLSFTNSTRNGTAAAGGLAGDFTFRIQPDDLTANLAYQVKAEVRNSTELADVGASVNSSYADYTLDSSLPSTLISIPLSGSTVVPTANTVTFEYTPSDTNLGNCSLHINNVNVKGSTSPNLIPNVTVGIINRFTNRFGADNNSVRVAIPCIDLAGNSGTSQNFTFNVLLGGISPAIRQAQSGGSGFLQSQSQPSQGGFSITPPSVSSTHLEQYGWAYFIAIALLGALAVRKLLKKR